MIDDELDRLLQDIEGEVDYTSARAEAIRDSERIARKGDKQVQESGEGAEEGAVEKKMRRLLFDSDLHIFKNGIPFIIQEHRNISEKLKRTFADASVSEAVEEILKKYQYTFSKFIDNINQTSDKYIPLVSEDVLSRKAKQDYVIVFTDNEDGKKNRIAFLKCAEIFIPLREFNSIVKKEWEEIHRTLGILNLTPEGKQLYLEIGGIIQDAFDLSEKTEKFLSRLHAILGISDEDYDVLEKDLFNKITYHENLSYDYDSLFESPHHKREDSLETALTDIDESDEQEFASDIEADEIETEKKFKEDLEQKAAVERVETDFAEQETKPVAPVDFSMSGTRSWNTRVPYVILIHPDKLEQDYTDLNNSFLFLDDSQEGSQLEGAIKIALLKFLKDKTQNIVKSYSSFLFKSIDFHVEEIGRFFGFDGDVLKLFIYHLGPFSVYRILINWFQMERIGSCYKYLGKNKASKFIPYEFVKETVLYWFQENINKSELPFDNIQEFNEFRKTVSRKYYSEIDRITSVIDEVAKKSNLDSRAASHKLELFRSKWNQWFGIAHIVIYKRFIEKTIFTTHPQSSHHG